MRDWYYPPEQKGEEPDTVPLTWSGIFTNWACLEADFHSEFGIDLESGVLKERTWRWFNVRMSALVNDHHSRLARALMRTPAP